MYLYRTIKGKPWKFMENQRKSWETRENHGQSTKNQGKPMKIHGQSKKHQGSMDNRSKSVEICRILWKIIEKMRFVYLFPSILRFFLFYGLSLACLVSARFLHRDGAIFALPKRVTPSAYHSASVSLPRRRGPMGPQGPGRS